MSNPIASALKGKDPIGHDIQIVLLNTKKFTGIIFSINSKIVILQENVSKTPNIHIINLDSISTVKILHSPDLKQLQQVVYIPILKMQNKERLNIKIAQENNAKIGIGVTKDAQDIFDALSKTLPCKWDKNRIIVLDEIQISFPYKMDNCNAIPGKTNVDAILSRVQKVLQGERKKLALND